MQESGGMGGGSALLCVEDFFSSRLKALTKLSSARKSWLGQRGKKIFYSLSDSTDLYMQSLKTTVQQLLLHYNKFTIIFNFELMLLLSKEQSGDIVYKDN